MHAYEASTTVSGQGEIHLVGVPFQPGAEVKVVVSPAKFGRPLGSDAEQRVAALLATLDRARNDQPVGPLQREALYDRDHLR
jgi:hypothetical protein